MHVRWAWALAVALLAFLATRGAFAWQEAHQTGQDARLRVEPNGLASLRLDLGWSVVRGPLKFVDVANVDAMAVLDPHVTITSEDGHELTAQATRRDDWIVRVVVDEPRALMHGHFIFQLRWQLDLAASRALARDGSTWRIAWATPSASDGFDSLRTVFDLPAAPDAPRPIAPETGAVDDSVVATLQREPGRDLLEMVRPHVARGESVSWTIRVDRRALAASTPPRPTSSSTSESSSEPDWVRGASRGAGLLGLAIGFGFLVAKKARTYAAVCAARGTRVEGLLPVPPGLRAPLAGAALAAAAGLQMAAMPTTSALCIAVAILAATLRAPRVNVAPRGPGQWFALRPADAFASSDADDHCLHGGASAGQLAAVGVGTAVVLAAFLAARWEPAAPWLVVMDAAPLAPLVVTGLVSQLPPGRSRACRWLAGAFRQLHASDSLRVAPWARVLPDGGSIDELRLLVLPRAAMPGVIGLEVGLAWAATPVGWAPLPEVLARVLDGSAAAARIAGLLPDARALLGRRPEERVVRLIPSAPTPTSTVALARALADALTDRRAVLASEDWTAPDRRAAAKSLPEDPPRGGSGCETVAGLRAQSESSEAAA